MNIHRAPVTESFCPLPNALLQDKELSFRARGILVMMLSMPLHWQTYHSWLTEQGKEGEEAVRTALRELEAAGYLTKRQRREQGRMAGFQWDWYSVPVPVSERTSYRHKPESGKAGSDSSGSGKTLPIKDSGEKRQIGERKKPEGSCESLIRSGKAESKQEALWKPSALRLLSKEDQLDLMPAPTVFPSENQFCSFLSCNSLGEVILKRPDLYMQLCRDKWLQWRPDLYKWVPIRNWQAYVTGLNETIAYATIGSLYEFEEYEKF